MRLDILDLDGRSLLYNCIKFNYIELLNLILQYNTTNIGISILDLKDRLGLTALHYSVIFNNYKCFKLLIQNNANPYLVSNDGHNVFHVALLYDHIEILNYLLDHNYPLSFLDHNGETLLQNAIKHNNPKKQNLPELTNSKKIANSTSKKSKDFLLPEYTNIIFKILICPI